MRLTDHRNAVIIPIVYLFYPETGHRSLEEVDVLFEDAAKKGNAWFSVVKVAKSEPFWYDKNGDPSDKYDSEKGRSSSPNEKANERSRADSDAIGWSEKNRERKESGTESETTAVPRPSEALTRKSSEGLTTLPRKSSEALTALPQNPS
jgi:hypothetical protein